MQSPEEMQQQAHIQVVNQKLYNLVAPGAACIPVPYGMIDRRMVSGFPPPQPSPSKFFISRLKKKANLIGPKYFPMVKQQYHETDVVRKM